MIKTLFTLTVTVAVLAPHLSDAAPSPRRRTVGTSTELGFHNQPADVTVPPATDLGDIVGMAFGPNRHLYVWYADGQYSEGTSTNFSHYQGKTDYELPDGRRPFDILAIAMNKSNGRVYTYYTNRNYSVGDPDDLGAHDDNVFFTFPPNQSESSLVGAAITNSQQVYTWYADGTRSRGSYNSLGEYSSSVNYAVPSPKKIGHIIDIAIAKNGRVYTWYHDIENGSGHSTIVNAIDVKAMDIVRRYRFPGLTVSASKNGRVVLKKGYGFADFDIHDRIQAGDRCRIGSVSKVVTALSAMHLHENDPNFSVSDRIYIGGGALDDAVHADAFIRGTRRMTPVIAKAFTPNDQVYTWNHNLTVTRGTVEDPDAYSTSTYTLAPGMTPENVKAIAIAPNGLTWVWYDDKTFGRGTFTNLDVFTPRDEDVKASASPRSFRHVIGADFAPNGNLYVYYEDGTRSVGTVDDFDAVGPPRSYSIGSSFDRYDISTIAIAKGNGHVFAFFGEGIVTEGWSRDLDDYQPGMSYAIPLAAYDQDKNWLLWYAYMQTDHLLSHTAGFSGSGKPEDAAIMFPNSGSTTYEQVHLHTLRTKPLLFEPGTTNSYSNHGAGVVGHVVSRVSGMSFRNYARTHIINPLGLNFQSKGFDPEPIDMKPHKFAGNAVQVTDLGEGEHHLGLAAGGWKASMPDMVRLMLATDQKTNRPDILSPQTLDLMESYPHATGYAHGWARSWTGKLSHDGASGGGNASIAKYPAGYFPGSKKINVAVCVNVDMEKKWGSKDILNELSDTIARAVHEGTISSSYDLY